MSDLDDEELEATRRLNGVARKKDKKRTGINVGNIKKDIKRCEKLTEPQNANWIGISNQLAIAHLIERIKELEAKIEFKKWGDLDNIQFDEYMSQFIPKQKVIKRINHYDERIKHAKQIKDREQEEFYIDIKRAFYKLLEDK